MTHTPTTSAAEIRREIRSVVREILREPDLPVTADAELRDQLGLDSADIAELLVSLESRLGVSFPDTLLESNTEHDPLSTVSSLAEALVGVAHAPR